VACQRDFKVSLWHEVDGEMNLMNLYELAKTTRSYPKLMKLNTK